MSTQPTVRGLGPSARTALSLDYPMSLGVYDEYEQAQKAVDYLSDHNFPVENVLIVGTDLRQLERVTGRLTWGRVAAGGLLSGMWIGSFVGLVFALFETGGGALWRFVTTVAFGAVFGLVWAAVTYRLAGGRRDFTSVTQVVATRYEVLTEHKFVAQARELLTKMDPMRAAQEHVREAQERARAEYAAQQAGQQSDSAGYTGQQPQEPGGYTGTRPPEPPR